MKLIRITTIPLSLKVLLKGQHQYMHHNGFDVIGVSSKGHELEEVREVEGIRTIELEMTRFISPIKDLKSLIGFYKLCRKEQPMIIHSHTPKAGLIGMLASKIAGVPIRLHTVAGLPLMEAKGLKRFVLEQVEKLTYLCANKVYPNSNNLKEFIIASRFTAAQKLKVIGNGSSNGINTEVFKKTPEISNAANELALKFQIKATDFVFVFVGRLVKDKGIEELVSAFHSLSSKYSDLRLLLVGPEERELDPLSEQCLEKIAQNKGIIAVGFQNDVKPYLALSNVLTFPSYREGFPNVPMQAGCFDLPAIVTNINGCNEIIVEGENGLIIPVKEVIALQNTMEKLYLDKELYKNMAAKARQMIVDRYEQKVVWDLILQEYNGHLKEKGIV